MTNIVVPVDFGETTEKLLEASIKFAQEIKGKIYLIHVAPIDIGFAIGDMGFQYFPEVKQNETHQELVRLNNLQQRVIAQGVDCEHLLKQGAAGDIIMDYATEKKASYIVIGSHGRSGIYDVFVGSLTKELTRKSRIPVLVIPVQET